MSFDAVLEDTEVKEYLRELQDKLEKIEDGEKKYAALVSSIVYADVINHFETQSGPKGDWPPWSKFYKEYLDSIGMSGNRILQFSGRLRQSFSPTNYRSAQNGILWYNNAKTKSGFPYAFAHNEGGSKLPKREFMYLSEKAMNDISEKTLQFLADEGL